ncbi:MAG: toll/interleukin-1 receptor domain-containing protein, partial [Gammaproteobacteria bacterium]|nr:toll/interleukin-1 receptor domain-containing protein [Gammaproteobacteria bacterium]
KLSNKFGQEKVFQDYNHIEAGEDFAQCIHDSVRGCNVFLVVIGKQWLTASKNGERRLDDPQDFVRLEIAAALKRRRWSQIRGEHRVIPVLVDGAEMPSVEDLPGDLADLANYQAQRIDTSEFDVLTDALIKQIKPWVFPWRYRLKKMIKPGIGALLLALLGSSLWNFNALVWWHTWQAERAFDQVNYVSAISNYKAVLKWRAENHPVRLKLADLAFAQGNAYESKREANSVNHFHELAAENYQILLAYFESEKKFEVVKSLASVYTSLEMPSEAILTYKRYLSEIDNMQLPLKFEVENAKASVSGNLGELYLDIGTLDEAITHFDIALDVLRKLGLSRDEADVLFSLANVHKKLNDSESALDHYHASWEKYCAKENFNGVAKVLFNGGLLVGEMSNQGDPYSWINNRAQAYMNRDCTV